MPALNFKLHFEKQILNGNKICTIRAVRKHRIRPGDPLFLFVGMRTKACRMFASAKCISTLPILIISEGAITVCSKLLSAAQIELLARTDGFASSSEFIGFFSQQYGLPFRGVVIKWGKLV